MVVGHEITHAFDQHGAKFDAKGNMRDWWSAETLSAFEKNSQCMIDQYSNYSILNTSLIFHVKYLSPNISHSSDNHRLLIALSKFPKKRTDDLEFIP
ncbi:unnamed protein product [Schistosoma curassoni]|uniref:Peptidase_M13 domain-containing protein n=1 Tax=Schistosoma curassoni TaxID=6186 RepID=A0A183KKP9_9TREM|nr:unnamed protein product [Schistosoma curassoni]